MSLPTCTLVLAMIPVWGCSEEAEWTSLSYIHIPLALSWHIYGPGGLRRGHNDSSVNLDWLCEARPSSAFKIAAENGSIVYSWQPLCSQVRRNKICSFSCCIEWKSSSASRMLPRPGWRCYQFGVRLPSCRLHSSFHRPLVCRFSSGTTCGMRGAWWRQF